MPRRFLTTSAQPDAGLSKPQIIPVCQRCRHRKQKCDAGVSGCNSCIQSGQDCCIEDLETNRTVTRAYVQRLEERVQSLRQALEAVNDSAPDNARDQKQNTSLKGNRRYIGMSSGITFIESAITFAKAQGILDDFQPDSHTKLSQRPESQRLLKILSPGPAQATPHRETVSELFDYFLATHWSYRILTREEFDVHLDQFFSGAPEEYPGSAIVIHVTCAISSFFLGMTEGNVVASNLAEIHYEKALLQLPSILSNRDIRTLQIILLVLLYSLLNPQKPVTWHLLGSALRLATFLGLHDEQQATIGDEKDRNLRRHLFWSLYSIDRAVGNTLGRPTALQDADIRVPFPDAVQDDTFNTAIANHCFRLRQLQSEVADTLYQKTRSLPTDYTLDIQRRLDEWLVHAPVSGASPQVQEWINHAYHNLTMFIYRPGLTMLTSAEGTYQRSFDSASKVLRLYAMMHQRNSIDCTWMAFHWLFLAAITHLFCLWTNTEIRSAADWQEVNEDLQTTCMVLSAMVERWRSGKKILAIYRQLSLGTLRQFAHVIPVQQPQEHTEAWNNGREVSDESTMNGHCDATMSRSAVPLFEDTLMDDEPGFWLNSPAEGLLPDFAGAASIHAEFGTVGDDFDPWLYHI